MVCPVDFKVITEWLKALNLVESKPRPGDQTRAALERDIRPQPMERDYRPVAKANQKIDVDEAPDHPGHETTQM